MGLTLEDQADVRLQLATSLIGTISAAVRAIRARVTDDGKLQLIAYFERVPWSYEVENLEDAAAQAALSLSRTRLRHEVRAVVAERPTLGFSGIEAFEASEFGHATTHFWAFARHGETPGDEDDAMDRIMLSEERYVVLR